MAVAIELIKLTTSLIFLIGQLLGLRSAFPKPDQARKAGPQKTGLAS